MKAIFLEELKLTRKSLSIWCFLIVLLTGFGMGEYPFIAENLETITPVFKTIPVLVQILFGIHNVDFSSPVGYFACMYFWCTLLAYTHAVCLGGSIISREQRDKTSEYLYTKPFSRDTVVKAKMLAAVVNLAVVAAVTGASFLAMMAQYDPSGRTLPAVVVSLAGMFFTQLVLTALGLLCSGLFPSYKGAVRGAVLVLIVSYCSGIAIESAGMEFLDFLSPARFFPVQRSVSTGLDPLYLLLTAAVVAVSVIFTIRLYRKKDFSV